MSLWSNFKNSDLIYPCFSFSYWICERDSRVKLTLVTSFTLRISIMQPAHSSSGFLSPFKMAAYCIYSLPISGLKQTQSSQVHFMRRTFGTLSAWPLLNYPKSAFSTELRYSISIASSSFLISITSNKVFAPVVLPYFFILRCKIAWMFFFPRSLGLILDGTAS